MTDGTAAGTHELKVSGVNPTASGLLSSLYVGNPHFTVIGQKIAFIGDDGDTAGLWVTDRTSAGTIKLIATPQLFSGGTTPEFTNLGDKVIFTADYQNPRDSFATEPSLWVTDGTAAGTRVLTVAGAQHYPYSGLEPNDLTVVGSKVLFTGFGMDNLPGLWVTDGTSKATKELYHFGLTPDYIAAFGNKALFEAPIPDPSTPVKTHDLWVTDGTVAGTKSLAVSGSYFLGLLSTVLDPDFTVLGSKVLFVGTDVDATRDLWITDATAAGTRELKVAGAGPDGLFSNVHPDFTVVGTKAVFAGEDASGHPGLWVTNGTSAGRRSEVAGANADGLFADGTNPGFAPLG